MTLGTERIESETGATERFTFFGDGPDRLAGVTHIPADPPAAAVLICPGLLQDFMKNYRTEVLLGRALAGRGIAVQRFQYRGTGNSDGPAEMVSFDTMREDVGTATAHLQAVAGRAPSAIVSARMGCLVAASCSSDLGTPSLVLFEPVLAADRYFREGFRARMVSTVTEEGKERLSSSAMVAELTETGVVDMVGFSLTRSLYESTNDLTLSDAIEAHHGKTLLVQLSEESATANGRFVEAESKRGRDIETLALDVGEAWWFIEDGRVPEGQRAVRDAATQAVATWIEAHVDGRP